MWYNTPHWKIIALICYARRSPKATLITVFVSIVAWKQARWPSPFYYVFNISLSCNINIPSFIGNLWWVLLLGNHLKDVRANCFCASLLRTTARANSHATSSAARQVLNWTMVGQMAIAIALLGFNDLGRSVTPSFLFRNRFHLQ